MQLSEQKQPVAPQAPDTKTFERRLAFTERTVIKFGPSEAIAAEAARTRQAHEIGRSTGLFRVPEVVAVDVDGGRLELERLRGLHSIRPMMARSSPHHPVWERLGCVLATVHARLDPPDAPRTPLPDRWSIPGADDVHIHGDFSAANLHYLPEDDMIVVLDWAPSRRMVGDLSTVGTRWFDVAWFLSSLFFLPRRFVFPRHLEAKANRFVSGYVLTSECAFDEETVARFALDANELRQDTYAHSAFQRVYYRRFSRRLQRYLKRGLHVGSYRASHSHTGKAVEYDAHGKRRYREYLWERERSILRRVIAEFHDGRSDVDCLDFACGTGRILEFLETVTASTVGVDISSEMLCQAQRKLSRTRLVQGDLTRESLLGDAKYDVITAFRFFLNAEDMLREEVMRALRDYLAPNGTLVFNNHMNHWSAAGLLRRALNRSGGPGNRTWRLRDVHALAEKSGLRVVGVYYEGILPGWERYMLLPRMLYHAFDTTASRIGWFRRLAQDVIFVCKREDGPESRPN